MKIKLLVCCCLSLLLAPRALYSQTLQASHLPNAGDVMAQFIDTLPDPNHFSISSPGPGQVWNYWTAFQVSDTNGYFFTNLSQIPLPGFSSFFSGSEFGIYSAVDSSAYALTSNSQGLFIDGFRDYSANAQYDSIRYINGQMQLPVPMAFNDQVLHSYHLYADAGYNVSLEANITLHRTTYQIFVADASGTFNSPAGSFPNCLRIHQATYSHDSAFVDYTNPLLPDVTVDLGMADTTERYTWVHGANPCYVAEFEVNPVNGQISRASFYNNTGLLTGLNKNTPATFEMYPNPASNKIFLRIPEDAAGGLVYLTDLPGKTVMQQMVRGGIHTLSLDELPAGYYIVTLESPNGKTVHKKLEISR